jgi:hypothetical protein
VDQAPTNSTGHWGFRFYKKNKCPIYQKNFYPSLRHQIRKQGFNIMETEKLPFQWTFLLQDENNIKKKKLIYFVDTVFPHLQTENQYTMLSLCTVLYVRGFYPSYKACARLCPKLKLILTPAKRYDNNRMVKRAKLDHLVTHYEDRD